MGNASKQEAGDDSNNQSSTDATCQRLLSSLAEQGSIEDVSVWASALTPSPLPYDDHLVGAVKRLERLDVVTAELKSVQRVALLPEGEDAASNGSPEARLRDAVVASERNDLTMKDVSTDGFAGMSAAQLKVGWANAMRGKLLALDKKTKTVEVVGEPSGDRVKDLCASDLQKLSAADLKTLKGRKLVSSKVEKVFANVQKGPKFVATVGELPALLTDLTEDALASGAWKDSVLKPFNFNAQGVQPVGGHLHPLLKVRNEYREVFLEMGFEEMPTSNYVESGFWNFDTLFQPQQHPARDAHDTFFLTAPRSAKLQEDPEYVQRVKQMHEKGGQGSIGWRYDWSLEESAKNILRTHTTAVSSRMLYKLANQEGGFKPIKYFSIDKVFRNEAVDATHLAEFHQIEGLVADYDLTLGNLMGVIEQFFHRLGVKKLRFKPAYNPYTEPSMEVFAYHEGLGKWVEIGNSGVFRPEMLLPMNLPENVRVIAWGLSLERPTMIKYGINNIRDLVGHKISLDFIKHNPMCRLDQEDE